MVTHNVEEAREALASDGTVTAREFLSQSAIQELQCVVADVYEALDNADSHSRGKLDQNFTAWGGVWLAHLPSFLRHRNKSLAQRYADIRNEAVSRALVVLGPKWHFMPSRSYFRRSSGGTGVGWHVDANAAAIVGLHIVSDCVNVWLPLDSVGVDKPSIDILPGSHSEIRPSSGGAKHWHDDASIARFCQPKTPHLQPGDAEIFNWYTLHRTQKLDAGQETIRRSCELRFGRRPRLGGAVDIFCRRSLMRIQSRMRN